MATSSKDECCDVIEETASKSISQKEQENHSRDEYFMRRALEVAEKALKVGEVPVGCVIVLSGDHPFVRERIKKFNSQSEKSASNDEQNGDKICNRVIISHGANQVNATRDATRHAEIVAIDRLLTNGCSSDQLRLPPNIETIKGIGSKLKNIEYARNLGTGGHTAALLEHVHRHLAPHGDEITRHLLRRPVAALDDQALDVVRLVGVAPHQHLDDIAVVALVMGDLVPVGALLLADDRHAHLGGFGRSPCRPPGTRTTHRAGAGTRRTAAASVGGWARAVGATTAGTVRRGRQTLDADERARAHGHVSSYG